MHRLVALTRRTGRRGFTLIAAAAVAAGLALALTAANPAAAVVTGHSGTTQTRIAVQTQTDAVSYTSATYTNVGSVSLFAPTGQLIDARFTAETACTGSAGNWCTVRILIDGVEAEPVVGTDFAFDNGEASTSWESHSVERVRQVTTTGSHTIVVQTAVVGASSERLDDWTLVGTASSQ